MLYLTKQKRELLKEHIAAVVEMAPSRTDCLSTAAVAIVLIGLPDNHTVFCIENLSKRQNSLLHIVNVWLNEQQKRELSDESPE